MRPCVIGAAPLTMRVFMIGAFLGFLMFAGKYPILCNILCLLRARASLVLFCFLSLSLALASSDDLYVYGRVVSFAHPA